MRNMIAVRLASETFAHSLWARRAASTAWSRSTSEACSSSASISPVPGFSIGSRPTGLPS